MPDLLSMLLIMPIDIHFPMTPADWVWRKPLAWCQVMLWRRS